jgi:hypothetical protein
MYEVAIRHLEWIDVDEEVLQIHPMITTISPYLARQLSVFYRLPTEGYTRGGKFRLGDAEIRKSKVQGTQGLDRFGPRCA